MERPEQKKYKVYEDIVYKEIDGRALKLDIYTLKNEINKKSPVVVFIHGGGWRFGTRKAISQDPIWEAIIISLMEKGFIVASIEYRFTDENVKFPVHLEDCRDAVNWLIENGNKYNMDTEKVSLWGASAGGHLALMLGLTGDSNSGNIISEIKCVVSWFGPTDFVSWLEETNIPNLENEISYLLGGSSQSVPEKYRDSSPVTYLSEKSVPILLIHGIEDQLVPISQSSNFYNLGKQNGADIELIAVEGANHGTMDFRKDTINPDFSNILDRMVKLIIHHGK